MQTFSLLLLGLLVTATMAIHRQDKGSRQLSSSQSAASALVRNEITCALGKVDTKTGVAHAETRAPLVYKEIEIGADAAAPPTGKQGGGLSRSNAGVKYCTKGYSVVTKQIRTVDHDGKLGGCTDQRVLTCKDQNDIPDIYAEDTITWMQHQGGATVTKEIVLDTIDITTQDFYQGKDQEDIQKDTCLLIGLTTSGQSMVTEIDSGKFGQDWVKIGLKEDGILKTGAC